MRLLLDTHIVLWRMTGDPRLSRDTANLMDQATNRVAVSVVSMWEVAIKHSLAGGRGVAMPVSGSEFLAHVRDVGLAPLPITAEHVSELDNLPFHHRDPFDRLLLAQARAESMHLLTHDGVLGAYGDHVIVV